MRLWHTDILPYLPRTQLLAQWRELNSIFKKQDKHLLINYIYNYDKRQLDVYSKYVMQAMNDKGYKFDIKNYANFFYGENQPIELIRDNLMYELWDDDLCYKTPFAEHNKEYMTICYWNLREKYLRGQKDFTKDIWHKLEQFYQNYIKEGK